MKLSANQEIQKPVPPPAQVPQWSGIGVILGLGLIGWLAFFRNLGRFSLLDETEPLFAEAARQMLVQGDWITPYFNEQTRFDKPPLIYWFMAIAYRLFGVNEWAARLPSALSAFLLISFCFYSLSFYAKKTYNPQIKTSIRNFLFHPLPWLGAVLMAFNPETIAWARIGVSDMLLTTCLGSGLLAFFLGYVTREDPTLTFKLFTIQISNQKFIISEGWYLAFYILIALAVLTKGPVGIVLPFFIIGTFLLYLQKGRIVLKEMRPLRGGLIFLLITLPWYILVTLANGQDYINSFFGYHNLERFTQVVNDHSAPWYFYFIVVLVGFAPYSVYLPFAIASSQFWKRRYWQRQTRIQHLKLFAIFWFACIFLFFTIAVTKLPSYVLPLMPAAAILVSLTWDENVINFTSKQTQTLSLKSPKNSGLISGFLTFPNFLSSSILINIVFLLLISGAIYWGKSWIGYDAEMPNFKRDLQASGLLVTGSLIWLMTALGISFLFWMRRLSSILAINLLGLILFLVFAAIPTYHLLDQHRQEPLRQIAQTVIEQRKTGEELVMLGFKKPSLVFYTQKPVHYYQKPTDAIAYIRRLTVPNSSLKTILIVGHSNEFTQAGLSPQNYQIITQASSYQLIRATKPESVIEITSYNF